MGYVYTITNKINGKLYVGMSEKDNELARWEEHLSDYKYASAHSKRPLYDAMVKYGVDNFVYKIIEHTNKPKEREIYWIEKLRTYVGFNDSNGYNATLGGDSRKTAFANQSDIEQLINLYEYGYSIKKISQIVNHDEYVVSKKLKELNLPLLYMPTYKVVGIDVQNFDVTIYQNAVEASKILHLNCNKIYDVIHGRRNSTGKKYWMKYDDFIHTSFNDVIMHIKSSRICIHGKEKKPPKFKRFQKFVCINTLTIFSYVNDAMQWCGEKSGSHIRECLKGQRKSAGKHPITKESLQWMLLDEYIEKYGNNGLVNYQAVIL